MGMHRRSGIHGHTAFVSAHADASEEGGVMMEEEESRVLLSNQKMTFYRDKTDI